MFNNYALFTNTRLECDWKKLTITLCEINNNLPSDNDTQPDTTLSGIGIATKPARGIDSSWGMVLMLQSRYEHVIW